MPAREKVMTWLEICGENRDCSATCPYGDGSGEYEDSRCRENLMADALAMLKEQESVKPEWKGGVPFCGNCGHRLQKKNRNMVGINCPMCKRTVKWDA